MKFLFVISTILTSIFQTTTFSQTTNNDRANPYVLCDFKDIEINTLSGRGNISDELHLDDLNINETNSMWIKIDVKKGGDFGFMLSPNNTFDDLDFVFYEEHFGAIMPHRVMTSGESFNNVNCLGLTGMSYVSDDIIEHSGCSGLSDNFISSISLDDNKTYFLFINNYNSNEGFQILFDNMDIVLKDKCESTNGEENISVYPTLTNGLINISINEFKNYAIPIKVFDNLGSIVKSFELSHKDNQLDFSNLAPGKYVVHLDLDDKSVIKKFIKI